MAVSSQLCLKPLEMPLRDTLGRAGYPRTTLGRKPAVRASNGFTDTIERERSFWYFLVVIFEVPFVTWGQDP
jgi:hypothetical protein